MHVMTIESKDLVKIIESCGKNGVTLFKCGDIEINFIKFVKYDEKDYPKEVSPILESENVDPNFAAQEAYDEVSQDTEELMITDPARYEEQLFKGDLEPSETHTDDE